MRAGVEVDLLALEARESGVGDEKESERVVDVEYAIKVSTGLGCAFIMTNDDESDRTGLG